MFCEIASSLKQRKETTEKILVFGAEGIIPCMEYGNIFQLSKYLK